MEVKFELERLVLRAKFCVAEFTKLPNFLTQNHFDIRSSNRCFIFRFMVDVVCKWLNLDVYFVMPADLI